MLFAVAAECCGGGRTAKKKISKKNLIEWRVNRVLLVVIIIIFFSKVQSAVTNSHKSQIFSFSFLLCVVYISNEK